MLYPKPTHPVHRSHQPCLDHSDMKVELIKPSFSLAATTKINPPVLSEGSSLDKTKQREYYPCLDFGNLSIRPAYTPPQEQPIPMHVKPVSNFGDCTLMKAFLKKTGSVNAISVTIHQPSNPIFESYGTQNVKLNDKKPVGANKLRQILKNNVDSVTKKTSELPLYSPTNNLRADNGPGSSGRTPTWRAAESGRSDGVDEEIEEQYSNDFENSHISEEIRESIAHGSLHKLRSSAVEEEIIASSLGYSQSRQKRETAAHSQGMEEDIIQDIFLASSRGAERSLQRDSKNKNAQKTPVKKSQSSIKPLSLEPQSSLQNNSLSPNTMGGKPANIDEQIEYEQDNFEEYSSVSQSAHRLRESIENKSFRKKITPQKQTESTTNLEKLGKQLQHEKSHFMHLQDRLQVYLTKKAEDEASTSPYEGKDVLFHLRLEVNRLIHSGKFGSKLKMLTSFMKIQAEGGQSILDKAVALQDQILKNVMNSVAQLAQPPANMVTMEELERRLKNQERNMRAEMEHRLANKDMQLKKMIAQLEEKFSKGYSIKPTPIFEDQDLSISILSDNVEWKQDLWNLLPDWEKRELYEKQTKEVTGFLTELMLNELKKESLDRDDCEVSFEFPDDDEPKTRSNKPSETGSQPKSSSGALGNLLLDSFREASQTQEVKLTDPNQRIHHQNQLKQDLLKMFTSYREQCIRKKPSYIKSLLTLIHKHKDSPNKLMKQIQDILLFTERQITKKDQWIYVQAYCEQIAQMFSQLYFRLQPASVKKVHTEFNNQFEKILIAASGISATAASRTVALSDDNELIPQGKLTQSTVSELGQLPWPLEKISDQPFIGEAHTELVPLEKQIVTKIMNLLSLQFASEMQQRARK